MFRKILQFKLNILARLVLRRYRPQIIAISGSIGKTSAKEAIALLLGTRFAVRASEKNYNNEIGLPLTILGSSAAGRSLLGWWRIFRNALLLIVGPRQNYPHFLILEMGIDRPGDMDYLCRLAPPDVGLITAVSHSHLQYFETIGKIKEEKQKLIEHVSNNGLAVLNYDDENVYDMAKVSRAKVMSYGFSQGADLRAQEIRDWSFKLNYQGSVVPLFMNKAVGKPAIYAILAAACLGIHLGLNLVEIAQILSDFSLPKGRLNIIPGLSGSKIIDDSYNANPASTLAALDVLSGLSSEGRYAVLGDMLELGPYCDEGHSEVGKRVAADSLSGLLTVGSLALKIATAAKEAGFPEEKIFSFDRADLAGAFLADKLQEDDVILVKGSQGARMEKAVRALMAEPQRAGELLVRQGSEWLD